MDDAETEIILYIICASWITCVGADAGPTAVCQDGGIDLFPSVLSAVRGIESYTDMIYAMAKKVARPARISVKNLAFSRDLVCPEPSSRNLLLTMLFATASLIFFVNPTMTNYDELPPAAQFKSLRN
jgi:hypothetical protein